MKIHPLLPLVCAALLSACAAPARVPEVPVAAYREAIELNGRLSVNYTRDGAPETLSGKFNWVQAGERVDVSLASPLGQTIAKITVTPREATLVQSDMARTAPDIDTLTAETLGWRLPVAGLRDWLQGYATAQDGSRFVASPANSEVVTRDGWRLRYVSWQDQAAGTVQPKRIDVSRPAGAQSEALEIRIVIDPA
ncbi:MAG TPA: outer membrane lipoprotein LolB [Telluria sp.]|nr:outer membrane lipoprotein LolB [Telluria sp.]